jgi:tetratricopeptide (TPR) repeat protein
VPNKRMRIAAALIAALMSAAAGAAEPRENSTDLYQQGAKLAIEGDLDKAIPVFKKVVEISPYYCLGHYGLGKAYLHKYGMIDDAIRHLKTAVDLDRKLVKGYFYLGIAYMIAKKYPQAGRAFKQAYSYDDTYIEALYNIGVVYETMDRSFQSGFYFNKYLEERAKEAEDIIF